MAACPLHNMIPDLGDSLQKGQWRRACDLLHSTNNFPEITGRLCSAPCETACAGQGGDGGVPVRQIEYQIAECGFANDWVTPARIETRSGKRVVVIGSGPAGLAAAQQLVRSGHEVIVFEKEEHVGGLLRYGIPDFKLNQAVLDRRLHQLIEEGVRFITGIVVGEDVSDSYLYRMCDAICVAIETGPPRDLSAPGRNLENVILGTEYLRQANMISIGQRIEVERIVSARDRIVAVVGGGDVGDDCVALANREGATKVYQFDIKPKRQEGQSRYTDQAHSVDRSDEKCLRRRCVHIKRLSGFDRKVSELHGVEVEWLDGSAGGEMREIPGTGFSLSVDLVLLAMGFEHVWHDSIIQKLGLKLDLNRNLVADPRRAASQVGVFATGDAAMEASMVGRAIARGREVAAQIDQYLNTDGDHK
jgi:glutamate synthase (NADPH/NADH) small chain